MVLSVTAPPSRAGDGVLEALWQRAQHLDLASRPAWLALLHTPAGGRSRIDHPAFFLAPDGADNPAAELEATLRAFGDTAAAGACRYPARFHWLDRRLGLVEAGFHKPVCREYTAWREHFHAGRMTLVFPEAFMNNPASMFGHTLLRIDSADLRERSDLLAYAVNFAAHTDGEDGLAYAVKGIAGFYPGFFSVAPYYKIVERYGDVENRDIWEYELALSSGEIEQILRHLYELDGVRFDYYFFEENCSYQLLGLLEVGRPGLGLLPPGPPWLIPVDSVRRVRDAGLVSEVRYRPSAATRLRESARHLEAPELRLARDLSAGRPRGDALAALDPATRAAVLSLAYDELRYRMLAGEVDPDASRGRALELLAARSRLQGIPAPGDPARPAVSPENGHRTRRVALESGLWKREPYLELRLRPAFHSLLDPEGGYTRGAAIEFMDLAVRYLPERDRVRIQELRVLQIVSLSPRDLLFRPISWAAATGLATRLRPDGRGDLEAEPVWRTQGGVGGAWRRGPFHLYAFGEALLEYGPGLRRDVALGPGFSVGGYAGDESDRWRGHVYLRGERILVGERGRVMGGGLEQRLRVGARSAFVLGTRWQQRFHEDRFEFDLRWSVFF